MAEAGAAEEKTYPKGTVLGHGSFGVVYESFDPETGEPVAIKSVYQDRRYKNRELDIMLKMDHPNVIGLLHHFYHQDESKNPDNNTFLNLVMEYIPGTVYRLIRNHAKARKSIPMEHIRLYLWQMLRSINHLHAQGICHRDIKPQNLLLDTATHITKLCDFGSAKVLVQGQANVAYICSRFYRAPELIFGATDYTTEIDIWSIGCVFAEMMIGYPVFAGESSVDQLVEIIKILGTPTKEEIMQMNPNYDEFKFPKVKPHSWVKILKKQSTPEAADLLSNLLVYVPSKRLRPLEALGHRFFDPLREKGYQLQCGKPCPPLFNFTAQEIAELKKHGWYSSVVPSELQSST